MTPLELKKNYELHHPNGRFFSQENMKHAGDTMSNFGCRTTDTCYVLYRKKPVKLNALGHFYFEKETFKYRGTNAPITD